MYYNRLHWGQTDYCHDQVAFSLVLPMQNISLNPYLTSDAKVTLTDGPLLKEGILSATETIQAPVMKCIEGVPIWKTSAKPPSLPWPKFSSGSCKWVIPKWCLWEIEGNSDWSIDIDKL